MSSRHNTVCTEPLLGDSLPGAQATKRIESHNPESVDIHVYEFLIEGESNLPDLEGIEEEQLCAIQ